MNTRSLDLEASSTQYLAITDASQTGLDITGNMTIEAWVNLESQPGTDVAYYIAAKFKGSTDNRSYYFAYQDTSGTKRLALDVCSDGSAANNSSGSYDVTLSLSTWTHVTASYTAASGQVIFTVNGAAVGTATGLKTSIFNGTAPFTVGRIEDSTDYGDMLTDELRVWNTNKSSTEISSNYRRQLSGSETNLQAYWRFNNSYEDQTSNNNDLTAINSPVFSTSVPFRGTGASMGFEI